jgi:hypothetical protein
MLPSKELSPQVESFAIGEVKGVAAAIAPVMGAVRLDHRAELQAPLFGMVENLGDSTFTFSVEESEDDGDSDAYAAINLRIAESAVADVDVVPNGRVVFSIEPSEITADNVYLRFKAVGTTEKLGRMVISTWLGGLARWQSRATA